MGYAYLCLAIAAEIVGTSALKASNEFTRLVPTIVAFSRRPLPILCNEASQRPVCHKWPLG